MRALYLHVFPNWCVTNNLDWHKGGRIVVAWNSEDMYVDILTYSSQLIHVFVKPRNGAVFHYTFVYRSTNKRERERERVMLFQQLHDISKSVCGPWIVMRDFNSVANINEHHGILVQLHEI